MTVVLSVMSALSTARSKLRRGWRRTGAVLASLCALGLSGGKTTLSFDNPNGSRSPVVEVEVAQTAGERSVGLMYRKSMPEESGMLFIFDDENPRSFWMKNTYIELDMIFVNSNDRVVCVSRRAAPLTETARRCAQPAKYVLEVRGGLAERWGIVEGSRMLRGG